MAAARAAALLACAVAIGAPMAVAPATASPTESPRIQSGHASARTGVAKPLRIAALGLHASVYDDAPPSWKEAIFRHAAASGASLIRVDVPLSVIYPGPEEAARLSGLDESLALARRRDLGVVAMVNTTPPWAASCPDGVDPALSYRCPYGDLSVYAAQLAAVVRRGRGVVKAWQIGNEPQGGWTFVGTPQDYAHMLDVALTVIRREDPKALVMLAGFADNLPSQRYVQEILSTPGLHLARRVDVASLHIRGPLSSLVKEVSDLRRTLSGFRFKGPIWVTEFGYPSDEQAQLNGNFGGAKQVAKTGRGQAGQAAYLTRALPILLRGGAQKVFVTMRDSDGGLFGTEGIVGGPGVADPPGPSPTVQRKLAFAAVRRLAADGALGARVAAR